MKKLQRKIPPLVLLIICMFMSWIASIGLTFWSLHFLFQKEISTLIMFLGSVIVLLAGIPLIKNHTTFDPRYPEKTSRLVISGLYSFSRNPMYLGMLLVLIGWSLLMGSMVSSVVIIIFIIYMDIFQIVPEEQMLLKKFGNEYNQYCQRVRRWL